MALGGQVNKVVNYTMRLQGSDGFQQSMRRLETAAGAMITAVAAGMVALTKSSVGVASAFTEMENQFDVVFGEAAPAARAELDAYADSLNRSGNRMMGFAAAIQDTFVPLGMAREEAAQLSIQAVQLATDLSSFKNIGMEETVTSITAALAGQHRSVQRLGIVIRESTLNQELMNMGIEGGYNAATEAEKALARFNLMLNASRDAMGDSARTSGEFENQTRQLEDAWYDARVEIGQEIIPVLQGLMPVFEESIGDIKDAAITILPQFVQGLSESVPAAINLANGLLKVAGALAMAADGWARLGGQENLNAFIQIATEGHQVVLTVDQINTGLETLSRYMTRVIEPGTIGGSVFGGGAFPSVFNGDVTIPNVTEGGTGGGPDLIKPEAIENAKKLAEEIEKAAAAASRLKGDLKGDELQGRADAAQAVADALAMQEQRTREINDLLANSARDFVQTLMSGGDDWGEKMLELIAKMGLKFAAMQVGGPIGGILGAFL